MTQQRRLALAATLVLATAAMGCSYLGSAWTFDTREFDRDPGWVAVRDVPFLRQEGGHDCGAAVLAMALDRWNVHVTPGDVAAACAPEPGHGIRAGALRDFARRKGLQAFLIEGDVTDIEKELSRRRPVVVGLCKPHLPGNVDHYELVVGLHPGRKEIVTLDPDRGWRIYPLEGFLEEWNPTQRLMLVLFRAAENPYAAGGPP